MYVCMHVCMYVCVYVVDLWLLVLLFPPRVIYIYICFFGGSTTFTLNMICLVAHGKHGMA